MTEPHGRLRDGLRPIAPIGIAAALFGVSFGVLASAAGLSALASVVMSATTFGGSSQFAAISVLDSDGAVAAAVGAGLLLNARYAAIGLSVAPQLHGGRLRRLLSSQLVVDESWAVAHRGGGRYDIGVMLGAGLVLYGCWVGGTAVGALFGDRLGDPAALGLDAAFPALFLALLVGQLDGRERVLAAILGGLVAIVLVPLVPAGVPVIAAAGVCLLGLREAAGGAGVTVWATVVLLGVGTIALKALGPVALGGRTLPARLEGALALLPAAVLAALVVTQTVADDEALVLDPRIAGIGAAAVALALRAPILAVVVVAAVTTAACRALGWDA